MQLVVWCEGSGRPSLPAPAEVIQREEKRQVNKRQESFRELDIGQKQCQVTSKQIAKLHCKRKVPYDRLEKVVESKFY